MYKEHKSIIPTALFFLSLIITTTLALPDHAICATRRVPAQFQSIQKAVDASAPGDKVQVAQGTYFEHVTLKKGVILEGGWNSGFTKRSPAKFETIIDGARAKGPVIKGADNAILDGFTIIHGSLEDTGDDRAGSGIYCKGTSPVIRNNDIRENEPSGVLCEKSHAQILNNRIHNNAQAGVFVRKGSDIKIHGNRIYENAYSGIGSNKLPVSKVDIRNNIIYANDRSGIYVDAASGTIMNNIVYDNGLAGIRGNAMPLSVINNTVVGNGQAGLFIDDPEATPDVRNNIFAHNRDAGVRTSGKGYFFNLFFANGSAGACDPEYLWCVRPQFSGYEDEKSYKRKGNKIADPLFVDTAKKNFHLKPGSPCIDAGDKAAKFKDVNFPPSMGSARNDMGAYGGPGTIAEKAGKNHAPRANAGPDITATKAGKVILDGTASLDPDGDALEYKWSIRKAPGGSRAKIAAATRAKAMLLADKAGTYIVQLSVKDSRGLSGKPDSVKITVPSNTPPKAVIGEVLSQVSVGDSLTLYGTASSDREKKPLTYHWSLKSKPSASHAVLQDADKKEARLTVDVDGCYAVELVVSDGKLKSEPAVVYISTKNAPTQGVRRVPQEYPTIQAAIDAAQPGDDIVVEKGVYKELITIDKSVNIIGKNWPVIDGGSPEGNKNTVSIFYLGDSAGKLEGFVITGGGTGDLGHGINIWDSSPEIYNNRITGNHHGMGIHGSPPLTGKTKIHGNLIYGNMVGIGNGKDSNARIYNNRVYNNSVVGIGCRGKALTRIEYNIVYNNRIGIGAREVAAPHIRGNEVFDNIDGIVIGPLSTSNTAPFKDIVIENNLVVKNRHIGINITSFNQSSVIIRNNTIADNNSAKRRIRAGGILLGYPQPGEFVVTLEKNIIAGNGTVGIANYTGTDNYSKPGVTLKNSGNILWNNTEDFQNCKKGSGDKRTDPGFTSKQLPGIKAYSNGTGIGFVPKGKEYKKVPAAI